MSLGSAWQRTQHRFTRRRLLGNGSPGEPATPALRAAAHRVLKDDDWRRLERSNSQFMLSGLTDYYFGRSSRRCDLDEVLRRLRWGGQFIFASPWPRQTAALHGKFKQRSEFRIDQPPQTLEIPADSGVPGIRRLFKRRMTFFVARKVLLDRADNLTERHSYDVRLIPSWQSADGYVVLKQVPSYADALERLQRMLPNVKQAAAAKGARKLVEKVFPIFLTREAAFLKMMQRNMPAEYGGRVPKILDMDVDERGLVQRIYLEWLRLGCNTLSQIEFARQGAEMLTALHEKVRVMHLDLRLDNFVVTERGVGVVDFGSAVRVGEDFGGNRMLKTLFNEMLSSSVIHHDLKLLQESGKVTSSLFRNCYQRMDRAIDLFYFALQMSKPHWNPDFKGLVDYRPDDPFSIELSYLRRDILRPPNPDKPIYRTARDIWDAITDIEERPFAA